MKILGCINLTDEQLETMYLDYFNNFIGVEGYADYYGLTYDLAHDLLEKGRKINQNKPAKYTFYIKGVNDQYTYTVQPVTSYRQALLMLPNSIPVSCIVDYKRETI